MDLAQFKLAVLSHNEFTDDQVEEMLYEVTVNDVNDIVDLINILKRNRPKLIKKLNEMIKKNQ
ncbi:MAG: hypothetical protein G01um10143_33 [Parcubacteria group bacterium Gr01-1014_3]|nr:MAG: hypothetical protein G01um10143_33 [Parcubacteria group bacterium Gr01-1014_3]